MQSLSHYSPLNCSSSTYFDVLSVIYSELCWAVCLCGESPNDSSVGCKGEKKWHSKSIQVKSITAPKDCCKGMMKFPSWQLNAQVDNCKKQNKKNPRRMKRSSLLWGQRIQRTSYYLRQVSHRPCPLNISWRAAVSRSVSHRERKARRNDYSVKWVPCYGEHDLNKASGEMSFGDENQLQVINEDRDRVFRFAICYVCLALKCCL